MAEPEKVENIYELLDIDPSIRLTAAEARQRIEDARSRWTKAAQGVKASSIARLSLERLTRLERALNIKRAETEVEEVERQIENQRDAALRHVEIRRQVKRTQLKQEIEFAGKNGTILDEEIAMWTARYGDVVAESELEEWIRPYKRQEQEGIKQRRDIEEALRAINEESLFSLVGVSLNVSHATVKHAADALYAEANLRARNSAEWDIKKNLSGEMRAIANDPGTYQQYRIHVRRQLFYRTYLQPVEATCDATHVITDAQVEYLRNLAAQNGWTPDQALEDLLAVAQQHGWRVLLPGVDRSEQTHQLERDIAEYKRQLAQRDEQLKKYQKAEQEFAVAQRKASAEKKQLEERLRDAESRAVSSRIEAKAGQKKSAEVIAEAQALRIQLDELKRREQEEERNRIANAGPLLAIYMSRAELLAAQGIIKSFSTIPSQWKDDAQRIERDLPEARRLLDEAKRVAGSDLLRAEQLLESALAKCVDLEDSKEFRRQLRPAPPSELRVESNGRGISLSWQPSPSRDVQYIVVRKDGSKPSSIHDGDRIGSTANLEWRDDTPPPARMLWYAVYAERNGTSSTAGASAAQAVFLVPDVADLRCGVTDGRITLSWRSPEKVSAIVIVRREGAAPRGFDDGKRYELGSAEWFKDDQVQNGVRYFYRVYCEYLDGMSATHRSEGVLIDVIPELPPREVPALEVRSSQGFLTDTVSLIAAKPTSGELRVYRSDKMPDILPSKTMPAHMLHTVFGHNGRTLTEMRDTLVGATLVYYTPVVLFHDTAYIGGAREYTYGPRLTNVRADTAGQSIHVHWKWPTGCEGAEIQCMPRGVPTMSPRVEVVTHVDGNTDDSHVELDGMPRGYYDVAVRARYRLGNRVILSDPESTLVSLGGSLVIRYAVRAQNRVFGGKQYQIVLSATEPLPDAPPCIIVRAEERVPVSPGDGELVPISTAQRRDDVTWVIPLDGLAPRRNTIIAVFPTSEQQHYVRYEPESLEAQRIL